MGYHELILSNEMFHKVRPPLSKISFPVSRVGKKKKSREAGNLYFAPYFIFFIN